MLNTVSSPIRKFKVYSPQDFPAYLPRLNSLYDDLFSDGKCLRSVLVQKVGRPLGVQENILELLAQTIEFIHNASLLHDDLVDRSALRRGKPAAWLKYSPEYAVLAGDYLLARVMVNLAEFGNIKLIQFTAEMISDLLEGEWIQDSLVRDWDTRLEQLDRVHNLKTASLFKWCLRAPFMAVNNFEEPIHKRLQEMGSILGLLFQRSDDLLDFNVRNSENKPVLGDLRSGYFNSVSVFLTEKMTSHQKQRFIQAQNLADVENAAGVDFFRARLGEFDDVNRKWIQVYHHHCHELKNKLPAKSAALIDDLEPLPDLLYWRNHKTSAESTNEHGNGNGN